MMGYNDKSAHCNKYKKLNHVYNSFAICAWTQLYISIYKPPIIEINSCMCLNVLNIIHNKSRILCPRFKLARYNQSTLSIRSVSYNWF